MATKMSFTRMCIFPRGGGKVFTFHDFYKPEDPVYHTVPYPFRSAADLVYMSKRYRIPISDIMRENERVISNMTREEVDEGLLSIHEYMEAVINRGLRTEGDMPFLGLSRQAHSMQENNGEALLSSSSSSSVASDDHFSLIDLVSLYARATNEENACAGHVITAPTNGACGTLPAVLKYMKKIVNPPDRSQRLKQITDFLLTAGAIGSIIIRNATISGAVAGGQAEVGSACSMAAAALTAVLGGSAEQIEHAAEIGLEHHLGMTCDPVLGAVQIPCIERNCVAAVQAITASRIALKTSWRHYVSFDSCVDVMLITGRDMQAKYRETSKGGLAVHARGCVSCHKDCTTPTANGGGCIIHPPH
eukprot:GHVO01053106.1.p1 GENE.GHVO01053106.1~~GHVO01053106.1.p1  ORF type:complete len:361 (-),score=75.47 GHVO01053106.1:99-1181(-)